MTDLSSTTGTYLGVDPQIHSRMQGTPSLLEGHRQVEVSHHCVVLNQGEEWSSAYCLASVWVLVALGLGQERQVVWHRVVHLQSHDLVLLQVLRELRSVEGFPLGSAD